MVFLSNVSVSKRHPWSGGHRREFGALSPVPEGFPADLLAELRKNGTVGEAPEPSAEKAPGVLAKAMGKHVLPQKPRA